MSDKPREVLTLNEMAGYLRIPISTAYKLAQEGKLPGQKVGKHWRFLKDTIDQWLGQRAGRRTKRKAKGAT